MVINLDSSIFSYVEGRSYVFQFLSDVVDTEWTVVQGELPSGMTLTIDGVFSGSPDLEAAGSFYGFKVRATNAANAGDFAEQDVNVAVQFVTGDSSGAPNWLYDLDTNNLLFNNGLVDEKTGFNVWRCKQTDNFTVSLGLVKGGILQDMLLANMYSSLKAIEDEQAEVNLATGFLKQIGSGLGNVRYWFGLEFTDDQLAKFLSEKEKHPNTFDRLVADLTIEYWQPNGTEEGILQSRTCNPFYFEVSRKL